MVEQLLQTLNSSMPFVEESFQRAMAKTVAAGKHEIESYINKRIHDAGMESLGIEAPVMLGHETLADKADQEYFEANPEEDFEYCDECGMKTVSVTETDEGTFLKCINPPCDFEDER
jgi:hypothetical protein